MNYILRPICNRPEFLHFSIRDEAVARSASAQQLHTVFWHDGPTIDANTQKILNGYKFPYTICKNDRRKGGSWSIVRGLEYCMSRTTDFVLILEDDVSVSPTFFNFLSYNIGIITDPNCAGLMTYLQKPKVKTQNVMEAVPISHGGYTTWGPVHSKLFYDSELSKRLAVAEFGRHGNTQRIKCIRSGPHTSCGWCKSRGLILHGHYILNSIRDICASSGNYRLFGPQTNRAWHIGIWGEHVTSGLTQLGKDIKASSYKDRIKLLAPLIDSGDLWKKCYDGRYNNSGWTNRPNE